MTTIGVCQACGVEVDEEYAVRYEDSERYIHTAVKRDHSKVLLTLEGKFYGGCGGEVVP